MQNRRVQSNILPELHSIKIYSYFYISQYISYGFGLFFLIKWMNNQMYYFMPSYFSIAIMQITNYLILWQGSDLPENTDNI